MAEGWRLTGHSERILDESSDALRIAKDHIVNCYCGMTWDELLDAEARGDISEKGRSLIAAVRLLERAGQEERT